MLLLLWLLCVAPRVPKLCEMLGVFAVAALAILAEWPRVSALCAGLVHRRVDHHGCGRSGCGRRHRSCNGRALHNLHQVVRLLPLRLWHIDWRDVSLSEDLWQLGQFWHLAHALAPRMLGNSGCRKAFARVKDQQPADEILRGRRHVLPALAREAEETPADLLEDGAAAGVVKGRRTAQHGVEDAAEAPQVARERVPAVRAALEDLRREELGRAADGARVAALVDDLGETEIFWWLRGMSAWKRMDWKAHVAHLLP